MFLWLSTKICFILFYVMGPSLCLEMNWPNLKTNDITAVRLGHDDNLEFLEFSEFLNSKIPSSELSLFALYQKTITRNFFPT